MADTSGWQMLSTPTVLSTGCRLPFKNCRYSHSTGRADGNQASAGSRIFQYLCQCADDSGTRGCEWVTDCQATAVDVEFILVDAPKRLVQTKSFTAVLFRFLGFKCAQNLGGKGLVNFIEIKIL